jgi:hypothetical protein
VRYKLNPQLGNWVNNQRQFYWSEKPRKRKYLTDEKLSLLEAIGFVWRVIPKDSGRKAIECRASSEPDGRWDDVKALRKERAVIKRQGSPVIKTDITNNGVRQRCQLSYCFVTVWLHGREIGRIAQE